MNLILPLKRKWFEEIQDGMKKEEYRLYNEYWCKRLIGKSFNKIIITLGYPNKNNKDRRIEFPWNGYEIKHIVSEEWGLKKKKVFAILLNKENANVLDNRTINLRANVNLDMDDTKDGQTM